MGCSYDVTVKATGRFFTDFLQSVDNIHSQFCFTYPKMKSPSIYLTDIDASGCILVYRSGRQGFTQYVMGFESCNSCFKFLLGRFCRSAATNCQGFL